jgi:tRNA isopentenyl-2-thiomethyl-A-37 hydroxylase MiaE
MTTHPTNLVSDTAHLDAATRNLAWKLNWYRQSELEGALLLGRMVRVATDGDLIDRLMRHCADEARHGQLWSTCIRELRLPYVRIHRSYQSFFLEHGGAPTSLVDVLAFTQIFERRVHKRFTEELEATDLPEAARVTFATMIHDERDHLAWVHDWLKPLPEAPALLHKYIQIDQAVYHWLQPYLASLWTLPALGTELAAPDFIS